ncbi:MAG: hypothetical protein SFU53_02615 [Terrimicrobiaceae bacterium]|nr:hypothetical protein [Terrimicrobiaceae bacterium]
MISRRLCIVFLAGSAAVSSAAPLVSPDLLVLKDGRTVRGLIIKNTARDVVLQETFGEVTYPKSEIVRIRDEADQGMEFTDTARVGRIPPWRVIANDLRTHDEIRELIQIPAVMVDTGEFRHVPYKSFRVNGNVELNVYGDPSNPAAIELGIYGPQRSNKELQRTLRGFLAGYLTTRQEVGALYSLDLRGGRADAGPVTLEITPPTAEDAFGAWWVALYNRKAIADSRLSAEEYERLTKPASEVLGARGRVKRSAWTDDEIAQSERMDSAEAGDRVALRGFYRDRNGEFRLIEVSGN